MTIFIPYVFSAYCAPNGRATNKMPYMEYALCSNLFIFCCCCCIFFVFSSSSNRLIGGRASTSSRFHPGKNAKCRLSERMRMYLHYLTIFTTIITFSKLLCLFRIIHFGAGASGGRVSETRPKIMLQIFTSISYTRQCIVFRAMHSMAESWATAARKRFAHGLRARKYIFDTH